MTASCDHKGSPVHTTKQLQLLLVALQPATLCSQMLYRGRIKNWMSEQRVFSLRPQLQQ